jgi:hypothetical protein
MTPTANHSSLSLPERPVQPYSAADDLSGVFGADPSRPQGKKWSSVETTMTDACSAGIYSRISGTRSLSSCPSAVPIVSSLMCLRVAKKPYGAGRVSKRFTRANIAQDSDVLR